MKPLRTLTAIFLSLLIPVPLGPAQQLIQDSEVIIVPSGDALLQWYGHLGRTYFIQASDPNDPLRNWIWSSLIESGNDEPISHQLGATAEQGFFRLHFTDQTPPSGVTLENWDADSDGLPNQQELTLQTHPLDPDTSGDGIPDGWAFAHGLNPLLDNSNGSFQNTTTTNLQAYQAGVQAHPNATLLDHDGDFADNHVDADPNDRIIDWPPGPRPHFAAIDLDVQNPEELRIDDLAENGLILFTRVQNSIPVSRVVIDSDQTVHLFPVRHYPPIGPFEGYGPVIVDGKVPGFRGSADCLWDPLAGTYTDWAPPTGYHDDIRDDRDGLTIGDNWMGQPWGLRYSPFGAELPNNGAIGSNEARIEANRNVVSENAYWRWNAQSGNLENGILLPGQTTVHSATIVQPQIGTQAAKEWNLVAGSQGMMVAEDRGGFQRAQGETGGSSVSEVTRQGWAIDNTNHRIWANGTWYPITSVVGASDYAEVEIHEMLDTALGVAKIRKTANAPKTLALLVPVEVSAVFERDQLANRIPNPKRPGYHAIGSSGNPEETRRKLNNRLFIAVEPESDKAEITIKHMKIQQPLASEFSIVITDDAGSIIKSTPIDPTGETDIDFVVTGTMGSTISYVDIARSSGSGGNPELILKSYEKADGLSIQVAKPESISASLNALAITIALVSNGSAGEFYRTYLGTLAHPTGALSQSPKVRIIDQTPPTMIAGSTYDQTTWNTEIRSFRLPDGFKSSDLLENYFSNEAGYGLHGVCRDLMNQNSGQIWNDFTTGSITSKVYNFPIIPETIANFYFSGTNNPKYAWGSANYLNGTVTLKLKKSGNKIVAEEVKMVAEIEDYYDFDYTRPSGSFSNHAAIVQIGNEGTLRPKGKVFHTVTDINFSYDESTGDLINGGPPISFFNANGYIENGTFVTTGGGGGGGNE